MNDEPYDLESVQDQYEDSAITLLVNLMMQEEGGRYLEESKRFEENHSFGDDMDKQALKTIDRHFSSIRRKEKMAIIGKAFSHVAKVFLIVFLIFSITFTTASAFREATMDFVIKTFDKGTVINKWQFVKNSTTQIRGLKWLPEGDWELTYFSINGNSLTLQYDRLDGAFVYFCEIPTSDGSLTIDTEDAIIFDEYQVNGYSSIMSIKEDYIILAWIDEDAGMIRNIEVSGPSNILDPEIVIKIAERVV